MNIENSYLLEENSVIIEKFRKKLNLYYNNFEDLFPGFEKRKYQFDYLHTILDVFDKQKNDEINHKIVSFIAPPAA
jgi:hypothetical protein